MWDIVWDELLTLNINPLSTRIMQSMYTDTISVYLATKNSTRCREKTQFFARINLYFVDAGLPIIANKLTVICHGSN